MAPQIRKIHELTISDGGDEPPGMLLGDDRTFEATGLIPGVDYQLSLPGYKIVEPQDGRVRAPAQDVSLRVRRGPVLRGIMGLRPGMDCPLEIGEVYGADESDEPTTQFEFAGVIGCAHRTGPPPNLPIAISIDRIASSARPLSLCSWLTGF